MSATWLACHLFYLKWNGYIYWPAKGEEGIMISNTREVDIGYFINFPPYIKHNRIDVQLCCVLLRLSPPLYLFSLYHSYFLCACALKGKRTELKRTGITAFWLIFVRLNSQKVIVVRVLTRWVRRWVSLDSPWYYIK